MGETRLTTPLWLRPIYFVLGVLSLVLGVIGIFLPLIPTTGPILIAAFFFARSSERLNRWIREHPRWGKMISDFQEGRGIPRRAKAFALIPMAAAFTVTIVWLLDHPALRIATALVGVWALWFVFRFPTSDPD